MVDLHEALIALNAGLIQYESDGTFLWDDLRVRVISWIEERYCIIKNDKSKYWFCGDVLDREDGPAVESAAGNLYWYLNGKLHREDGPAIITANGICFWYVNGYYLRKDNHSIFHNNII